MHMNFNDIKHIKIMLILMATIDLIGLKNINVINV